MTRQRLIAFIGLTISAVFLWAAFQGLDPGAVWESLRTANPLLIALAGLWYFAAVLVISLRWRFLLRPIWRTAPPSPSAPDDPALAPPQERRLPTPLHIMGLVSVGYMGNNVFPLRAGEILRVALAARDFGAPFARIATTVLVERILDGIVMLTFILAALLLGGFPLAESVRPGALLLAPLFVVALALFLYFALHPAQLRALAERIIAIFPQRFRPPLQQLIGDAIDGLEALRTPADALGAILFSYASWMLEASTYLIVARAFDLPVDYWAMLLVVGVVNLAGLIPASPGQFGVYETFVRATLTAIGVGETAALAFAFSIHIVIWLPVTLVGFYVLWRRGVGWNVLRRARELEKELAV